VTFEYSLSHRHRKLPYVDLLETCEDSRRKQGRWARKAASESVQVEAHHEGSVAGYLQTGGNCLAERSDSQQFLGHFSASPGVGSHRRIHVAPHKSY